MIGAIEALKQKRNDGALSVACRAVGLCRCESVSAGLASCALCVLSACLPACVPFVLCGACGGGALAACLRALVCPLRLLACVLSVVCGAGGGGGGFAACLLACCLWCVLVYAGVCAGVCSLCCAARQSQARGEDRAPSEQVV